MLHFSGPTHKRKLYIIYTRTPFLVLLHYAPWGNDGNIIFRLSIVCILMIVSQNP